MENTVFFSKCIVLCVRSVVLQKYFMYIYIYDIRTIYIYIHVPFDSFEGGNWQNAN